RRFRARGAGGGADRAPEVARREERAAARRNLRERGVHAAARARAARLARPAQQSWPVLCQVPFGLHSMNLPCMHMRVPEGTMRPSSSHFARVRPWARTQGSGFGSAGALLQAASESSAAHVSWIVLIVVSLS